LVSEDGPDRYLLITGERRWRAARHAGLRTVPAVIRERLEDSDQLELALVENLQRQDLTPLEEARALDHLRTSLGLSQAEISLRVGMNRSTVANSLRLLKLPPEIQDLVEAGALSAGHGRTLLAFETDETRVAWANRAVESGLSVRDLERAAAEARGVATRPKKPRAATAPDPNLMAAEEKLALRLGAKVQIRARRRGGSIVISCDGQGELMRVFDLLMGGE
jgi:ParB family chromosome partitioning protein